MACALAVLASGCQGVTSDATAPVAIEFVLPQTPPVAVEEFDSVVIGVRVRDQAGDTLAGAPIRLLTLTPDIVGVDSVLHFGLVGIRAGPGRVVAISGTLQSDPLNVTVTVAADSLAMVGAGADTLGVDTVATTDSLSAPLVVKLLDLHSDTTQALGLIGRPVTFAITSPVFASLAAATVTLGNDSLAAVVLTGGGPPSGAASVIVRRQGARPQPDSVIVEASATRASGKVVHGSPVRFVIHFQ